MGRAFFVSIAILILLAIDFYVFQGYKVLIRKWLPQYSTIAFYIYWLIPVFLLFSLLAFTFFTSSFHNNGILRWIGAILFGLYLSKLLFLLFVVIDDIIRLARYLAVASPIPNEAMIEKISRSQFILSAGVLASGSLFGGLVFGVLKGAHNYKVQKRILPIKDLPKVFEGLSIVQISDIHSGSFWNRNAVKKGVELIRNLKPDLVFFTGDLVNNKAEEFDSYQQIFSTIEARLGVFSVLGNHDYGDYYNWPDPQGVTKDQNLEQIKNHHAEMGWKLLVNEHHIVELEGEKMAILGVENMSAHLRFPKYGDLKKAYHGTEEAPLKLLLSHDPSHWKMEVLSDFKDIQATFSGHTHGMQFGVDTKHYKWSPIQYQYSEWVDLYSEGDQHLYVNRGFGYIGYPGRLGFYPEITLFELKKA